MADLEALELRVQRLLGEAVIGVRPVSGGYSPARRALVQLRSGRRVFAKQATSPFTAKSLRHEHAVYASAGEAFMPQMLGWDEHEQAPLLLLEDLSDAHWPPPWSPDLVEEVRATIDAVHRLDIELPAYAELHGAVCDGWQQVASSPEAFLGLGLASSAWLERALPVFLAASEQVSEAGAQPCHFDLRSDNMCRTKAGVCLIDWSWACLGNPDLDIGFWLPSLQYEGGPAAAQMMPERPDVAAVVSGFFASQAGLPPIAGAPHVRQVQLAQLRAALQWACEALALQPPG